MPRALKKIKDPQNEHNVFNRNFDDIALDLADRSGTFSSVAGAGPFTLAAGSTDHIQLDVQDVQNRYVLDKLPMIPRMDVFIDTVDYAYRWPDGSSLSAAQLKMNPKMLNVRTVQNPSTTNVKGQIHIVITNNDSSSHDYAILIDVFYVPAPETGVADRS